MDIQSFSVGYSIEEDRLLLTVQGKSEQHAYWLSRKATIVLAVAINRVLKQQYQFMGAQLATQHIDELATFGHESAKAALPIEAAAASIVVSVPPMLLYEIAFSAEDTNLGRLTLRDKSGNSKSYRMGRGVMHTLIRLLESQARHAEWGLNLLDSINASVNNTALSTGLMH